MLTILAVLLTGCQSLSSTASFARVRVIDISPDAPPVDIYQGNEAVAYNLSYGTVTSYVPITPGGSVFTVNSAGSRQVLSSIVGTFSAGTQYTVLVSNPASSLQQLILTDRGLPSASGAKPAPLVRFLHQAARASAVDVYLVPAGQRLTSATPVVTNLQPGSATEYLSVPNCTCTAVMLPAGTAPSVSAIAAHAGAHITYAIGSARTMILLDAPPASSSGLQVVTTMDAEPLN